MQQPATHTLESSLLLRPLVRRALERSPSVAGFVERRRALSSSFVVAAAPGRDPLPLLRALSAYVDR